MTHLVHGCEIFIFKDTYEGSLASGAALLSFLLDLLAYKVLKNIAFIVL